MVRKIENKKLIRTGEAILSIVGMAGVLALAAMAPNAVQLLKTFGIVGNKLKRREYELPKSTKRLLDSGLIKIKSENNQKFIELTQKGKKALLKYELGGLAQNKPKKWDGKYRVVIFDVDESKKSLREELRRVLRDFGFMYIQRSVWIYPYHCQEIIELLKTHLDLNTEVIYMTVDSIENDGWIRKNFGLI